mmetsp:Transcript_30700/g.81627  ORF Transcript_30700/g.81627 Transcript_30700/m.81627 type:complete len:221 (+) Transcript_30700:535-1197(+)
MARVTSLALAIPLASTRTRCILWLGAPVEHRLRGRGHHDINPELSHFTVHHFNTTVPMWCKTLQDRVCRVKGTLFVESLSAVKHSFNRFWLTSHRHVDGLQRTSTNPPDVHLHGPSASRIKSTSVAHGINASTHTLQCRQEHATAELERRTESNIGATLQGAMTRTTQQTRDKTSLNHEGDGASGRRIGGVRSWRQHFGNKINFARSYVIVGELRIGNVA